MTSKRHGSAFQYQAPKKSRLDISIHSATSGIKYNQQISAPYHQKHTTSNFRNVNQPAKTTYAAPRLDALSNQELLFDDADDGLLLLASQAHDGIQQAEDNISMSITSFDGFQPNNKSSTSTQKPVIISDDEEDYLKTFLIENDLNEKMLSQMPGAVQPALEPASSENMFAMDTEPAAGTSRRPENPPRQVFSTNREHRNENIQKNINNSKDTQIKFMMNELEKAKLQKYRFEEEIKLLVEKCQTKDGEIAMVRYDLQQSKKKQCILRQEKQDEIEKNKSDLVAKITDLVKDRVKLQAELDFKNLDAMKGKHSLNKSIVGIQKQREMTEINVYQLMKLHFTLPSSHQPVSVEEDIFSIHVESNTATINRPLRLNVQHNMQQKQIVLVQSYLSQLILELNSGNAPDSPRLADITHSTWTVATKCFIAIRRHVSDMEYEMLPADRKFDNAFTSDAQQTTRLRMLASSVHQDREMFDDERLHTLRRLLACLSSVCRMSEQFCGMFLNRPVNESKSCCQLLTESLQIIGHSKSWLQYAGIVEASARLLSAMAKHYTGTNSCDAILYNLQHAIVFCRPTGRSLLHIARFLYTMSTHHANSMFMQSVCKRDTQTICLHKHYQKIMFGWKTCTLQMYGMCLQTEFFGFQTIEPEHFELLAELTELTILLLQNCAKIPVHWMLRPVTTDPRPRPCSCYGHLVCASIVLLHRCFKNWTDRPKCMDLKVIERLAKLAIVSIHDNFVTHCENVVLQLGGTSVKQRLHSVFYWILQHRQLFNLDNMHDRALSNIEFLRRIPYMVEPVRTSDDEMIAEALADVSTFWKDLMDKHL